MKKKAGFTLIELLVVIVIIGIMAVISIGFFRNAIERAQDSKTIDSLVSYQDLLDRFYATHEYYPAPDLLNSWVCLGNYSAQDTCYYYLWNGNQVEYHGDDKLKSTLLSELGAEFNTANYDSTSEVSESLLYLSPANGLGYAIWFMTARKDFDCTRLKGLNDQNTSMLTSEKNSWTGAWGGGKEVTYCFYVVKESKPANYTDL